MTLVAGPRRRGETGSADAGVATVVACVAAMAMVAVLALGLHLGSAVLARQRAENAADLAALAGAAMVLQGNDIACGRAAELALANGAVLADCRTVQLDLLVQVRVSVRIGPLTAQAAGRARAGPVG